MNSFSVCKKYCIGCGLCASELNVPMKQNEKGYSEPEFSEDEKTQVFLEKVCPVMDTETPAGTGLWGNYQGVYGGWSTDSDIRKAASSGGVLTGLAIYLLESGSVDGILQIKGAEDQTKTVVQISTTKAQVTECLGSRYAISNPFAELSQIFDADKTYAVVAKPCDIKALRRLKDNTGAYSNIKYLLSFFCAGLPSVDAQNRLVKELGTTKEQMTTLTYRGNGWPGYATAVDKDGESHTMEYSKAWGGILGRDVHPFCRLCIDGIGENADIACGDGWYQKPDGTPDFAEREGRNVIFTRSETGAQLLEDAVKAGYIELQNWENVDNLEQIQNYQYMRKATMSARISAYKLCGKAAPAFRKETLKKYAKSASLKAKFRIFGGTLKRIVTKKIV